MFQDSSKQIAEALALRANQPEPISLEDYRRFSLLALAAILREVDSLSFQMRNKRGC